LTCAAARERQRGKNRREGGRQGEDRLWRRKGQYKIAVKEVPSLSRRHKGGMAICSPIAAHDCPFSTAEKRRGENPQGMNPSTSARVPNWEIRKKKN